MINFINESVKEFIESVGGEYNNCEKEVKEGFIGKIEVEGDLNYDVYLKFPKYTLDIVSELLFGDEEYDLEDLLKEIVNIVVGKAKVFASNKNIHFDISIPEFIEQKEISFDEKQSYSINGKCFTVFIKGE